MSTAHLRKLALQLAEKSTNPKSRFAHLHPDVRKRVVDKVYQPNMPEDELFKAISEEVSKHTMPKNPLYEVKEGELKTTPASQRKRLSKAADKLIAANSIDDDIIDFDGEHLFDVFNTDVRFLSDDELFQNTILERIKNKKAQDWYNRIAKEKQLYEEQNYYPTLGDVTHIEFRKNHYDVNQGLPHRDVFNASYTNNSDPFAGGIDILSDLGSGVDDATYKKYLDLWRSIK